MRVGGPLSVALHLAVALGGMIAAPALINEPTPMVILPVELLEIGDTTNVAPVVEEPKDEADNEEAAPSESAPAPAARAPEPTPEIFPADVPPPKKVEPKAEATPKPAPPKQEAKKDFNDELDSILKSVEKTKSRAPPAEQRKAASLSKVEDAAPRRGAGDNQSMTITVAEFVRQQLLSKGCWTDQDDMPDAKRLRASFRIRFGRDGHFIETQQMVEPSRPPQNDPPLNTFIARANVALNKCNHMGFQVPAKYFEVSPPQWIIIDFLP